MPLFTLEEIPALTRPTAVCLGMFDGVHKGHQTLIKQTVNAAREKNLIPCAFTFDTPPAAVLFPEKNLRQLTDLEEKSRLLHLFGLEHVCYARFDPAMSRMPARDFFETVLLDKLNARHIVIGFHYRFGRHAEGDETLLRVWCQSYGLTLDVVPPVTLDDGTLISSTAIRQALQDHNLQLAQQMLGYSAHP